MPEPETDSKPSRTLWIFAACGALALHLGGAALAVAHLQTDQPESVFGGQGIEIDLEMTSPHADSANLPPGPDKDASAASAAQAEQRAAVKQTELPKDPLTETDDPDRVASLNDPQKPREDDPKVARMQTSASDESLQQEAMATPSVQDVPEGRSQAPVRGIGESLQRLRASWFAELTVHFAKHKRQPDVPKLKNVKVVVNVTFDRRGHVIASSIAQSSGDPAYDKAALAMLRRSDPVPRPPPLIADEGLTYTLPVRFDVKERE